MASFRDTISRIRADLPSYGFNDYLRNLPSLDEASAEGKPLRVAVLRSYTVEPLEPVLKLQLFAEGFRPSFWIGGFNQYVQEIVDPSSALHQFRPDLVLLMVRLEEIMPDFLDEFTARPLSEWESRIAVAARDLGALVTRIEHAFPAQVLVQNMTLARDGYFGIYDAQRAGGQRYLVQRLNEALAVELTERRSAFLWDFDSLARREGYANLFDPKMWFVSKNPYKQSAYPAIATDLMRYVRSALGIGKKCVVLDLDNTLWGGVAGEDGIEGIRLGHSYPGNCYRDFQKELLKLYRRGVLLAINSKNNEEDAFEIIDRHPDMILRREHFAAVRINWRDKAANLRQLASELNIGLDSCVMIDDNPAECALLKAECPECEVILLPEKPYLIPELPGRIPGLENIRLTDEDRRKSEMYRARAERQALEGHYTNLDEFLRHLDIEITMEEVVPFSVPRVAQLTQKTNQMNVTTRRYTEAQIQSFAADPNYAVYSVASKDRFGDDGIVGVVILQFEDERCRIDSLLLSCRVIGRGIEQLMVAFVADVARRRGASFLIGEFIPTAKNLPAAGLFEQCGFERVSKTHFRRDLDQSAFSLPGHIRLTGNGALAASNSRGVGSGGSGGLEHQRVGEELHCPVEHFEAPV